MIQINLPPKFKNKLGEIQHLDGIVTRTIAEFGEILIDNKLYFFEEYTDHGVKHIESVLESSANLVTENTFANVLTGKDIGCYILSTVLHDIAMHITVDGFNQLLTGAFDDVRVEAFDKHTWAEIWDEYLSEAKKFNNKQLIEIFGDENVIIRKPPLLNKGDINNNDRKLIGEFIRRHHPRLAHEIALKGFPGKDKTLEFAKKLDQADKELIGLIARSHGLDLRTCTDYIESEYGSKTRAYINKIHVVFLMILLRLADYLQIDKTRTSPTLVKVKFFSSPFSEFEHDTHLAIDDVNTEYHLDPERIFVQASPKDSKMYLKIRKLLQDIQHEFDFSWAVLGELYGNIENKPEIRYRRITSNIHEEKFRNKQNYVADNFHFKSNEDVVKLLIAPLYGNQATYGVRELLQNAVDACREREIIERAADNQYKGEITINIFEAPDGDKYFEIKDNGIGMSVEIIKDYFLTVGASYRKSFEWQKKFIDQEGNSSVTRSGQFGVGVLAAFLIGQRIDVETKNIKSNTGYKFTADLNAPQINILKDHSLPTGTTIKIKIDNDKLYTFEPINQLFYSTKNKNEWAAWYALSDPIVNYWIYGEKITPPIKPGPDPNKPTAEWRSMNIKEYNKVFWTHDSSYQDKRKLICNGIVIPNRKHPERYLEVSPFYTPKISVVDNNMALPLTLNRDRLSNHVSFRKDLHEDICKDFLAYVLLFKPGCRVENSQIRLGIQHYRYPGTYTDEHNYRYLDTFFVTKDGILLNTPYSKKKCGITNAIRIKSQNLHRKYHSLPLDTQDLLFTYEISSFDIINEKYLEDLLFNRRELKSGNTGIRIFLNKEIYIRLLRNEENIMGFPLTKWLRTEYETHNVICLIHGSPSKSIVTRSFLDQYSADIDLIEESQIPPVSDRQELIDTFIERYLGENVIIPYSLKEREKLYPRAFKELEYYMLKHKKHE